ncbi:MAG TPA: Twin-arginine translocation pathway signal [Marinobacterium sp.]|nr:Twin-arginine translocation pathway signal [Marinobacterium sp.]
MKKIITDKGISRRSLLKGAVTVSAGLVVGVGFVAGSTAAWALETQEIDPREMATLIQMARDIYPHNHVADEFYARAVKGYDAPEHKAPIQAGIAALDAAAQGLGFADYLSVSWEVDRVKILQGMEQSAFFQTIRGNLVTGLYNQKEVWPLFGYEGESYTKGGYISRGFDDINWI